MDRYETDINREKEMVWKGEESDENEKARGRNLREQRCGKIRSSCLFILVSTATARGSGSDFRALRWELARG